MNPQKPKWIGQPFTVGIFVRIFLEENVGTLIQITQELLTLDNKWKLEQVPMLPLRTIEDAIGRYW